jgi:hypothetical protein
MEPSSSLNDFVVSDLKCKAFEGRDGQDVLLQWCGHNAIPMGVSMA